MEFRIGDRDPATGLYQVIWPDGGKTLNGLKIFNAAHQPGDVVLANQRSDGMIILDSAKAIDPVVVKPAVLSLERPVGYLQGQVFNNDEEPQLPIVSIRTFEYLPGNNEIWLFIEPSLPLRQNFTVLFGATFNAVSAGINKVFYDPNYDPSLPLPPIFSFDGGQLLTAEMTVDILFPFERAYLFKSVFNIANIAIASFATATFFLRSSRSYKIGVGNATVFINNNSGGGAGGSGES